MLDVRDLSVSYGKHLALSGASLSVGRGEIVVILGANGAGKTTLLKAICGISEGKVTGSLTMENEELAGKPPEAIVEAGIALVPEGRGVFGDLSVQENLLLGAYAARALDEEAGNLERVHALFPKLAERRKQTVRTMSGGEQQMVAIGRAMMSNPLILALDEPSLGLSPLLCKELFQSLAVVREAGLGVLLVEQNAKQSLAIADRGYLLENGGIVHQDTAKNLASDPAVQKAYLGAGSKSAAKTTPAKLVLPAKATPRRPPAGPSPSEIAAAAMKKVVVPASRPQAALPVSGPPNAAPAAPKAAPRSSVPPASGELDLSELVSRAAQMSSRRPATPAQTNGATPRSPTPTPKPQAAHSTLPAVPMPDLASSTDRLRSMLDEIEAAARRAESYRPILSQSEKRR